MEVRIGQVLIEGGVLSREQVERILDRQLETGEPFGVICERQFAVDPEIIERAWATQYASLTRIVNPLHERLDEESLNLVTRRQAWQFRVLPLRFDGDELMLATTQQHLRRALRFACNVMTVPVYVVLCAPQDLGEALCRYYPLPGMSPRSIDDTQMDAIIGDHALRRGA